jgi:hypothetical protein
MTASWRTPIRRPLSVAATSIAVMLAACSDQATQPRPRPPGVAVTVERAIAGGQVFSMTRVVNAAAAHSGVPSGTAAPGTRKPAQNASKAKRGLMISPLFVDPVSHRHMYTKAVRLEPGAPIAATEMIVGGKVVSAVRFDWKRDGKDYVLTRVVSERYDETGVVLRSTYEQTSADVTEHWESGSGAAALASVIRGKKAAHAAFNRAGTQDLCGTHDCPLLAHQKHAKKTTASPGDLAGFGVDLSGGADSLAHIECTAQKHCYALLASMIASGIAATAALAATSLGAVGTVLSGGTLLPAEAAAAWAYISAEAAFVAATAAYWDCRTG